LDDDIIGLEDAVSGEIIDDGEEFNI